MGEESKTTIILVVIVGALAIVAIVVSAVSLARNGSPAVTVNSAGGAGGAPSGQVSNRAAGGMRPQDSNPPPAPIYITPNGGAAGGGMAIDAGGAAYPVGTSGRIYSLAIGHDYGSHEYFDSKGFLSGFGIGIVDLVCSEAGIDCRMVWDRYDNCWDSQVGQHATGGQGLHDRWYDGCTGWYTTIERIHVFNFASPYLKEPTSNIYVLKGRSFSVNKDSLESKKILFLEGWASDEKCLYRVTKANLGQGNAKYVTDTDAILADLKNGWDAAFTTQTTMQGLLNNGDVEQLSPDYSCMIAGNTIMTRKDSDLPSQWNRGFSKIRINGKFKKYCEDANKEHADKGHVTCIDAY